MGINRGKQFEEAVREAFNALSSVSIDRFADPMAGYAGIRNICDFGVYQHPFQYYIECKAFSGNTLNFQFNITKDQWNGLSEKSMIPGVSSGILIWFIDHDITTFVPIQELIFLRNELAEKSLHVKHIQNDLVKHIPFPGKKKRSLYRYDADPFLEELRNRTQDYWNNRL